MTPEGRIKESVKQVLRRYKVYWHCPMQNGMGAPALDFACCCKGAYFAIETKALGKKPTMRQEITIQQIRDAGGKVFVIDGDLSELEHWLKELEVWGC